MAFLFVVQQPEAVEAAAHLDQIATALTIIAVSGVVVGLFAVVSLVASMFALRSANRAIGTMERHIDRLAPRVEPLIDQVTRLADDSRHVTDTVRRRVHDLMDSVDDLNRGLKQATQAAEIRVREFAAVIDVVKEEAEEVLIDTAATARGLQSAAEKLRGPSTVPAPRPVETDEETEVAS